MGFKAIVFDMNGLFVEAPELNLLKNICSIRGTGEWIAKSNYYLNLWNFERGFYSPYTFWKRVFVGISELEYKKLIEAHYELKFLKNEALYALLDIMAKKYDLYLLSNSNFLQGKAYRKQKLYAPFKEIFLSHEVQEIKPFPNIFNHFLEQTKLKPNECVFVDDSTLNVLASMALGFKGIVFQNNDDFEEKLKKMNIL
ncbi:MAG: HAD-IA family hydrolase [archaeon]|nr:HAD-IA family hydrolase [archaeon]